MARNTVRHKTQERDETQRILAAALDRAEEVGWDALRLSDVATATGLPTARVMAHFRDKDALANAWFAQALAAMLDQADVTEGDAGLETLLVAWLDQLAKRKAVTVAMLKGKLYPGHPHHWVPLIFDLSRFVHWLRDAAGMAAGGRRRQAEEIALSLLVLRLLRCWCRDNSPEQTETKAFLARALRSGAVAMRLLSSLELMRRGRTTPP